MHSGHAKTSSIRVLTPDILHFPISLPNEFFHRKADLSLGQAPPEHILLYLPFDIVPSVLYELLFLQFQEHFRLM